MKGIFILSSLLSVLAVVEGQQCLGTYEKNGEFNTFPSFDQSTHVVQVNSTSIKECREACTRVAGCKSFYFGTEFLCGEYTDKRCSLFPVPFRSQKDPLDGISNFGPATSSSQIGLVGNRGGPISTGAGWWMKNSVGNALTAPETATTVATCRDTCLQNPECKSWSFTEFGGWFCEHFKQPIRIPSQENKWKNVRLVAPAGFGGYSANMERLSKSIPPGCKESELRDLYDAHEQCLMKEYQRTGGLTVTGCAGTADAALKRVQACLMPPPGMDTGKFFVQAPTYDLTCRPE